MAVSVVITMEQARDKILKAHTADIRHHRSGHPVILVDCVDVKGHLFRWEAAAVIVNNLSQQHRKMLEAMYIKTRTLNT